MYILEQWRKAVELFIANGHNDSLVIRILVSPSPNALRQWWTEYEQTGVLHEKCLPNPRFTTKQIDATVEYYLDHGYSLIGTCRTLGYLNRGTLAQWIKVRFPDGVPGKENSCRQCKTHVRLTQEQQLEAIKKLSFPTNLRTELLLNTASARHLSVSGNDSFSGRIRSP